MSSKIKFALVSAVLVLMGFMPAYAASHKSGSSHSRSQSYHDRTPKAHVPVSHPHRQK